MKTKIKYFMFGILFFIFGFQAEANLTAADTISALTSGIKHAYYDVTWCSPHAGRLSDTRFSASADCQKGYFNNVGGVGKMTYKGESFSNGNVALNTAFIPSTRTSGTSFIDFFSGISSVSFEGEGIYTIRILLVDHAYNASKFEFSYKIDKTAPQFQLTSISETHPNIFVDTSLTRLNGLNGNIVKHDSLNESSSHPDTYNNPLISSYTGDVPSVRTNHERQNLYVMYFKDLAAHPFELNVAQSDNYNGYMRNYVAGPKGFDLMPETGDTPLKPNISLNMAVTLMTQDLAGHPDNSQKKYRLRLYDNTVGKSGGKPNYSEIIFYAVKDNTNPNRGAGLASTNEEAIERLLKFDASTPVWDDAASKKVSKFISAKTNQSLYSLLQETGIKGASSDPAWYNAGVPLGGGTKIAIEQAYFVGSFSDTITYQDRFDNNNILKIHNFSQVDNNRENGYRKYKVNFQTNGISGTDKICDNVGNCLNPELAFRVVANTLATTTSNISLELPSGTTKIFANGSDSYNLTTQLKDAYRNAIVGVTAVENGNRVIKKADITFNFTNGLHYDQLANSGGKGAIIEDKLSTKNAVSTINTINDTNSYIYFEEKPENGSKDTDKGTYTFSVASRVPSVGGYPYLKNDSTLKLNSINPKAVAGMISGVGVYGDIGLFNSTQILSGINNFLSTNTQFLTSTDYKNDLTIGAKDNYGIVTLQNSSDVKYATLNTRKLEFDFASPAIYGAEDFSLSHLINNIGATQKHTKLGYTFSGVSSVSIFEQYLPSYTASGTTPKFTPGIFNIFSNFSTVGDTTFDTSKINNGDTISLSNNWSQEFKTKSSPIQSNYQIAGHGFNMGYISSLNYTLDGKDVKLPSISRNVGNFPTDDVLTAKRNSRFYFPADTTPSGDYIGYGNYTILGDPIISAGVLSAMGIAITGMSNSEDLMIVDKDAGRKANLNVGENLTRYDMIKVFKQNIEKNSRGITWCTGPIEINDLNNQPNLNDCTLTLNGEKISFIKGNVDINCGIGEDCILDNNTKRTIIVKDGSTYINSNISTFGKNAQLVLGTIANVGLKNITLPSSNNPPLSRNDKTYGWTFIDPKVTNIDAFIVSQGPMVSYDGGRLYNAPTETDLKNQLHIYGSTLSLNTVGGYKSESDSKCPYIVENCDQKNAFIFDLVTLRRYSLVGDGTGAPNYPVKPSGDAMRSGQKQDGLKTDGKNPLTVLEADTCTAGSDDLRCITDTDYIIYPLFIERDVNASKSPSVMFKVY